MAGGSGKLEGFVEDLLLRRNGADEVVALAEEAVGAALEVEAGRNGLEEQLSSLEVRLGVVDVVRVLQEQGGDTEARFDFDDGEKRHVALAYGFQALHRPPDLPFLLLVVRQRPQPLRHRFHLSLSLNFN